MSRIGKQPVVLPKEVQVNIKDNKLEVKGPKGTLNLDIPTGITLEHKENEIVISRANDEKLTKSLHGTIRALINNMVIGVKDGFKKELEIQGVGYKAQMKGSDLVLNMGFSHPVEIKVPKNLKVSVPKPNRIDVEGVDKQCVGELAAKIRRWYPPEPYKGKGIRYVGEEVRKKLGKALAK